MQPGQLVANIRAWIYMLFPFVVIAFWVALIGVAVTCIVLGTMLALVAVRAV